MQGKVVWLGYEAVLRHKLLWLLASSRFDQERGKACVLVAALAVALFGELAPLSFERRSVHWLEELAQTLIKVLLLHRRRHLAKLLIDLLTVHF